MQSEFKQRFLAAMCLLLVPAIAAAANYRSSFGFPFSLSGDWKVYTPQTLSKLYKDAKVNDKSLTGEAAKNFQAILDKVKHGQVEFYFEQKYSSADFNNNISTQLSPGGVYPTSADADNACASLAKGAEAIQGQPVKVKSCGLKQSDGIPYMAYEYTVPGRKMTVIQREIPYLVNANLLVVGGSNDAGADTVRKNADSIVAGVTRYLAMEKREKVPSARKQVALVKQTMHDFALAVNAKDFTGFYPTLSLAWRQVVTVQQLNEGYKPFITKKINLLPLDRLKPQLKAAHKRDKNDVLVLEGYYPTKPARVKFHFEYLYEAPEWKLAAASVNLIPAH